MRQLVWKASSSRLSRPCASSTPAATVQASQASQPPAWVRRSTADQLCIGAIVAVDPAGGDIIAQKSAFLCAESGVTVSAHVVKNLSSGLFGGEGFVLQRLSGNGLAFLEIDGALCEKTLAPGESLIVDTGNVAAFEARVQYEVTMVEGFKNILLGGEGLLNTRLTGPGKVWLQTMTMPGFAKRIIPFLPTPPSNNSH